MEINFNELKKKEVVDIANGKNLGKISDLIIDADSGVILKIIVPGKRGGFLNCEEFIIDYKCIVKIGDDAILYKKCHPRKEEHNDCCNPCRDFDDE